MKFKKLNLYTNKLESLFKFYAEILGFEIVEQKTNSFSVKAGWTELSFKKSDKEHVYHYCFLIPANKLEQALAWMEDRIDIVEIEPGRKTQNFASWNADSFYFYDTGGNIAEFIVRYDLGNSTDTDFNISDVLGVNEIGMPTSNVKRINEQLENELKTEFWKGNLTRFGTNGSEEGIFLLVNYNLKHIWYPTSIPILPEPFEAVMENKGQKYKVVFKSEQLETSFIEKE